MEYCVTFGGGFGPDVWDGERIVDAVSVGDAFTQMESEIEDRGGQIFSIEQQEPWMSGAYPNYCIPDECMPQDPPHQCWSRKAGYIKDRSWPIRMIARFCGDHPQFLPPPTGYRDQMTLEGLHRFSLRERILILLSGQAHLRAVIAFKDPIPEKRIVSVSCVATVNG